MPVYIAPSIVLACVGLSTEHKPLLSVFNLLDRYLLCILAHFVTPPPPPPTPRAHQSLPSNTRQEGISIWAAAEGVNCCENERKQSPSCNASQCLLHKRPPERWGLLAKSDLALIGWQTGLPLDRDAYTYAGVDKVSADAIRKQTHSSWKLKC